MKNKMDLRSSQLEHAFIKGRIAEVESHFEKMGSKAASYVRKLAHVRDSGDELANAVLEYSAKESLNASLRHKLAEFSDSLLAIQEYRETQIRRIESKVIPGLAKYKKQCKSVRADLKNSHESRMKEIQHKNNLEKAKCKIPLNWKKINEAERELSQAQDESNYLGAEFSKKMTDFEHTKLKDLQHLLLEFIKIEMVFHCKAIEMHTKAYNAVTSLDIDGDLKEFQSHFRAYSPRIECPDIHQTEVKLLDESFTDLALQNFEPMPRLSIAPNVSESVVEKRSVADESCIISPPGSKFEFGSECF